MRPLIGVLPLYNAENESIWMNPMYLHGIEDAGGQAAVLSLTRDQAVWEDLCQRFDGFLFTGGQDVGPERYGQEKLPQCNYQAPLRDDQELWMLRRLLALDKPVLGICRGVQILNVALGGTLYQDLPTQFPSPVVHLQQKPYDRPCHSVAIDPASRLYRLLGRERLPVNSVHHQAIRDPAPALRVSARAEDGLIEAVELPEARFLMGVQWHPEHMWRQDPAARDLWRAFVTASAGG